MRTALARFFCASIASLPALAGPPPSYDFDFVTIGAPGNPAYDGSLGKGNEGRGSVGYEYRMARTEVTSAQWLEFLNVMAPQSGNPFSFGFPTASGLLPIGLGRYELNPVVPDAANLPVFGIEWREAALFCNWLNNGKPALWAEIQAGAYDASTFTTNPDGTINDQATRSQGAQFWIPSLDEWIKAAHFDPDRYGEQQGGWWKYSHTSDSPPVTGLPGFGQTSVDLPPDDLNSPEDIPLGAYPDVRSPWGLLDTSGGASEWTDELFGSRYRGFDGTHAGETTSLGVGVPSRDAIFNSSSASEGSGLFVGLRVASAIPGPSTITGLVLVATGMASFRRRHT